MKVYTSVPGATTIKADLGIQNGGEVHKYFTERCYAYMGKFTPGGPSGQLHRNVQVHADEIVYNSPYAHFQWRGIVYIDPVTKSPYARRGATKIPTNRRLQYHTPGTGRQWDSKMWASEQDRILREVQNKVDSDGGY